MIDFLLWFFLLLFFGSFIISGWFLSTREGFVFEFWSKFWEKKKGTKRIYTEGEKLYKKYREIEKVAILCGYKGQIKFNEGYLSVDSSFEKYINEIEHHLLIHLVLESQVLLYMYEEELVFRFPMWVRNPVSSCPTCYASIYGSLVYWIAVSFNAGNPFEWATNYTVAKILTWIAYCFSLAYLNTFLNNKINHK